MIRDAMLFLPETAVLLGVLVTFLVSMAGRSYREVWMLSVAFAMGAAVASMLTIPMTGQPFFPGIYQVDAFSQVLKAGLSVSLVLVLLTADELRTVRPSTRMEIPIFFLAATAGLMMLTSATELLTIYVALELAACGMYITVAVHSSQRLGSEAGAKYIVFGVAASAVTLYGMSLVYAMARSTYLGDIAQALVVQTSPLMVVGILLMSAAFLFKLAVFPFHAWAPDAYEGAPHQSVTFIGTASKVAAVGILARTLAVVAKEPGILPDVVLWLSVASMTYGNIVALVQEDLKRLLAYSTIAHAGYILIGFVTFSPLGTAAAMFYVLTYMIMGFLPFLVISAVGRVGHNPSLAGLEGLHTRSPLLALALLVGVFGLAGVPPTPGFAGKWFLFSAAIEDGRFWLVLVAAVNSTVSLYYYLQIVRRAYATPAGDWGPVPLSGSHRLAAVVAIGLATVLGVYPQPVWDLARVAAAALLGG